ncbi:MULTISPECIES: hypothetical protein [Parabacteroides]|uniref:Uncharacterized protein n=2 Tax=Parabacteroides distasonis TaxID=823 RepID=A0A6I2MUW4_PARDI|nr:MULTISPECIES: hypothetical protein [Parabacteroides]MBV4228375.1 hypothetical protein [Parabacteroides distasonis]MCS2607493.1 hypothetical protein [Parabacteroides distasonis]MDB9029311.1 hypothetical protein [Parabacteroides distasonis]MDB9045658.1 hypothetical protein [Parabacteroides distasonis]MDB9075112.1 hypothetical protein [Parabacteroides distasonis]
MNSKRTLVSGKFAKEIKEKALRIQTGDLDERDKKEIQRNRRITKEVSILWK